jgi:pimeloyl-ACP methyl ester carboxylesterase
LIAALEARGHDAVAMDLPLGDGSATFETYADAVERAIEGDEPPILVGHSLGSMVIPIVAARRLVDALVFLCGVIPRFGGFPWDGDIAMQAPGAFDGLVRNDDGSTYWPTLEAATAAFYHDCRADDAAWAFEHLRAMNPTSLWDRPYPLTEWPEARRISIIATNDLAVTTEWAKDAAENRLQVTPIEIGGDHSPFLGRPDELADLLVAATGS